MFIAPAGALQFELNEDAKKRVNMDYLWVHNPHIRNTPQAYEINGVEFVCSCRTVFDYVDTQSVTKEFRERVDSVRTISKSNPVACNCNGRLIE